MKLSTNKHVPARTNRGQVAVEFMLYLAVFMVVLIAGYVVVLYVQGTELPFKEALVIKETAQTFVAALSLVNKGGAGFEYVVSIPSAMFNKPYELQINDAKDLLVINAQGSTQEVSFAYPIPRNTYLIQNGGACVRQDGDFIFISSNGCNGLVKISNSGGSIVIAPYGDSP